MCLFLLRLCVTATYVLLDAKPPMDMACDLLEGHLVTAAVELHRARCAMTFNGEKMTSAPSM